MSRARRILERIMGTTAPTVVPTKPSVKPVPRPGLEPVRRPGPSRPDPWRRKDIKTEPAPAKALNRVGDTSVGRSV